MCHSIDKKGESRYYRIGELAKELGITPSTLRYYEKELGLKTKKTPGGHRVYSAQDRVVLVEFLVLMNEGYTVIGAKNTLLKNITSLIDAGVKSKNIQNIHRDSASQERFHPIIIEVRDEIKSVLDILD